MRRMILMPRGDDGRGIDRSPPQLNEETPFDNMRPLPFGAYAVTALDAAAVERLRREHSTAVLSPMRSYRRMWRTPEVRKLARAASGAPGLSVRVTVVDASSQTPIPGAHVLAFTRYQSREGAEGRTGWKGAASLALSPGTKAERIYVEAPSGYWGRLIRGVHLKADMVVELTPLELSGPAETFALSQAASGLPVNAGAGVRVAVIDDGVEPDRPDLLVEGGANLVSEEIDADPSLAGAWGPGDRTMRHGTHVAGVIAMRPTEAHPNLRGVAPGAVIRSYRVFPTDGGGTRDAVTGDIAMAIHRAVLDGCDVINLSLGLPSGQDPDDLLLQKALNAAFDAGVLVVAASGNDGRSPVAFPARASSCFAVGAYGVAGVWPKGAAQASAVSSRATPSRDRFVAAFSNHGPAIDFIAPGVAVISTVPGGHAPLDGTSMACPAVAGFAAHVLSERPDIRALQGGARTETLAKAMVNRSRPLGFGPMYEGFGILG